MSDLIKSSLTEILSSELIVEFVSSFVTHTRTAGEEHMWTLTPQRAIRQIGCHDSVRSPDLEEGELVLFEVHNHPAAENQFSSFLHLSDIAAGFNGSTRVFGTYAVLVQNDCQDYVVATRFKRDRIDDLLAGNATPHTDLFATIQSIHDSESASKAHAESVARCRTIDDVEELFASLLFQLEFARRWASEFK